MVYLTKELLNNGETEYSIRNKVSKGELFSIGRGVYSDEPQPYVDESYLCSKYPNAIITGLSAFYIYDLTDYIPDKYHLATRQHSFPINNNEVIQSYQDPSFIDVGKLSMEYGNGKITIYNLERLLIELIRLKEKYPKDIYYEAINSFRKIKDKLDFYKINEYSKYFKNGDSILQKIKEVI